MNKNRKNTSRFYWIPVIVIMIAIFLFSAQTADHSEQVSNGAAYQLARAYNILTRRGWETEDCQRAAKAIDFYVRKAAHMTEYAGLCAFILLAFYKNSAVFSGRLLWKSVILSVIYAATDEFHQLFVPGRGGSPKDVFIDGLGALIGGMFLFLILRKLAQRQELTLER